MKPAVCVQRLGRPLRVLEVALEDVWTLDADLVGQRFTRAGLGWERPRASLRIGADSPLPPALRQSSSSQGHPPV